MKILSILMLGFLSVSCATGYHPTYTFNEIQVVNLSAATITNVNLRINGSDKTVGCDAVAKNALCQTRFGKRRYPQQLIELSWIHADGSEKLQQLVPAIAAYYSTVAPLRLMLEINEDGSTKAFFEQDSSFRAD